MVVSCLAIEFQCNYIYLIQYNSWLVSDWMSELQDTTEKTEGDF